MFGHSIIDTVVGKQVQVLVDPISTLRIDRCGRICPLKKVFDDWELRAMVRKICKTRLICEAERGINKSSLPEFRCHVQTYGSRLSWKDRYSLEALAHNHLHKDQIFGVQN